MSKVIQLNAFRSRDTVAEVRELLVKGTQGAISGLVFGVEFTNGEQRVGFTGKFRGDQAEVAKMAHHLRQLLKQLETEQGPSMLAST